MNVLSVIVSLNECVWTKLLLASCKRFRACPDVMRTYLCMRQSNSSILPIESAGQGKSEMVTLIVVVHLMICCAW